MCEQFVRIDSNLRFAILALRSAIFQKSSVREPWHDSREIDSIRRCARSCESIRANRAILSSLRLKPKSESVPLVARVFWTVMDRSPLPNISASFPLKMRFGDPKSPLQENIGKFWEIRGFLWKNVVIPSKRPIQGTPRNSLWESQLGILGWFSLADESGQSWYVGRRGAMEINLNSVDNL